ncbi:MAG: hypothetical protein ACJ758_07430, partial [Actinomycetota bacterium]
TTSTTGCPSSGSVPVSTPGSTTTPPPSGGGGGNNNGGPNGGTNGGTGGGSNGGTNGGTGGTPRSTTQGSDNVSLLDVFTRHGSKMAQVSVNRKSYTLDEGEHFHQHYELVSISGSCAAFLYGDSPFTLCTTARK